MFFQGRALTSSSRETSDSIISWLSGCLTTEGKHLWCCNFNTSKYFNTVTPGPSISSYHRFITVLNVSLLNDVVVTSDRASWHLIAYLQQGGSGFKFMLVPQTQLSSPHHVRLPTQLHAFLRKQRVYFECSLVCFTEALLSNITAGCCMSDTSGKKKGGGLVLPVNNSWCTPGHFTVMEEIVPHMLAILSHRHHWCFYFFTSQTCCEFRSRTLVHSLQYWGILNMSLWPITQLALFTVLTLRNKTLDLLYSNPKEA